MLDFIVYILAALIVLMLFAGALGLITYIISYAYLLARREFNAEKED